ncbi:hypothetical protein ACVGOW_06740 [Pseudonocardia saturnea]
MSQAAVTALDHRQRLVAHLTQVGAIRSDAVRRAFLDIGRKWDTVVAAVVTWVQLDRPAVTDFRVTAHDHERLQHVFCDWDPAAFRWPLPL